MLTLPEVRRYSTQSGLRDMMIAEKEIVLQVCFFWIAHLCAISYDCTQICNRQSTSTEC